MNQADRPQESTAAGSIWRDTRLVTIFWLGVIFSFMSVWERDVVHRLNAFLGWAADAPAGWSAVIAVRMALTAWLVWCVWRLPSGWDDAPRGPREKREKKFDPLLGLRAMACLMVILGHYFIVVFAARVPSRLLDHAMMFLRSSPWGGVWIFFTLSGFLMGKGFASGRYPLDAAGLRRFYRNRILRILPVYVTAVLLFSVFLQPEVFRPKNLWQLGQVLCFDYRGADTSFTTPGALWSISAEMNFYLLVPFIVFLARGIYRSYPRLFVAGLPMLYVVMVWLRSLALHHLSDFHSQIYATFLGNLDVFVAGMSISLLPATGWKVPRFGLTAAAAAIYAVVCLISNDLSLVHLNMDRFWVVGPALVSPMAALFILLSAGAPAIAFGSGIRRVLLRSIEWTGVLAYALYVFHSEVMISLRRLLPAVIRPQAAMLFFPFCLSLIYLLSIGIYRMVEAPFEKRKHVPDGPVTDAP